MFPRSFALSLFSTALASAGSASGPGNLPDLIAPHIAHGCEPDAQHYVAELSKLRPDVHAETFRVEVTNEVTHGLGSFTHVLVLIDANGYLYARDEFFGILDLHFRAGAAIKDIKAAAIEAFSRRSTWHRMMGHKIDRLLTADTPTAQIASVKTLKSALVPSASIYIIGNKAVAVWRSGAKAYFYAPDMGTLTLESKNSSESEKISDVTIARDLAKTLGYNGEIRPAT